MNCVLVLVYSVVTKTPLFMNIGLRTSNLQCRKKFTLLKIRYLLEPTPWLIWKNILRIYKTEITVGGINFLPEITVIDSWFQTFAVFWMLYTFFWVILQRLNFICWRLGTLRPFHLHRQVDVKNDYVWEMLGYLWEKKFDSKLAWANWLRLISSQTFPV